MRTIQKGERVLLVEARNLGDAVISTSFINTLGEAIADVTLDVLTRHASRSVFEHSPYVNNVLITEFPVGRGVFGGLRALMALSVALWKLRQRRYDWVVNLVGDFREDAVGWIMGRSRAVAPLWSKQHPRAAALRRLPGLVRIKRIKIPHDIVSVYDGVAFMAEHITGGSARPTSIFRCNGTPLKNSDVPGPIGLHPFATDPSRVWTDTGWRELLSRLLDVGREVVIFGAPAQQARLREIFGNMLSSNQVRQVTANLSDFLAEVADLDIMVCLESFAAHAAYAVGTRRIVINGSNSVSLWAPPGSVVLSSGERCRWFPCYCRRPAPCVKNGEEKYLCIRGISPLEVFQQIQKNVSSSKSGQ